MQTLAIARRELGSSFASPVAYIVLSAFLLLAGFMFFDQFFLDGNATLFRLFQRMPEWLFFFAPAIAMRLLAEERGSGTMELLATLPVADWEVVVGKFLAAFALLAIGVLLTIPYAITVAQLGPLDLGPVIGGYVGTLLLGATYLSFGLLASALTKNQIVAFVVGLAFCFGLFVLESASGAAGPTVGPVLEYLSPGKHFQSIARGVIELKSIVYYVTTIVVVLLLTSRVLEARRWR